MYIKFFKRLIDIFIAMIVLIVFSPIILITAFILAIINRGSPFFFQLRPGERNVIFKIIKFKTMTDERSKTGELLPDEVRLTKFGTLVRKLSLDELPQMINVLKGDMSLIGPRPLLIEYLPLYSEEQARRHDIKPGITGWAQVNGRNTLDWQTKFEFDVWYVDHCSFMLDLRILFLTLKKVVIREGISSGTSVTMEKFKGNT
uniref:sugar transferase n=1 Tax=Roseivirga sp. TaxID=1964215 RepID=UPI004047C748